MGDIAIRVENLGKRYRIGQRLRYQTFRDALSGVLSAPFRGVHSYLSGQRPSECHHESDDVIWALKDVSFDVKYGEVIGVIGRNGAGKSTFLKILSRITKPTEGYAEIHGRVGSLLEVGTGFHPDLTGRENIYLNGAILGITKRDIDRKFDEIVAFAEIEKFLDTPVKHYSSGMYMRLAFAVAAHLEPEILLVDEVLAVGDAAFQKKCLGKMDSVAREGRTVLFVSHNMQAISVLARRGILLANGRCVCDDVTAKVISQYLREGSGDELVYTARPSCSEPTITRVELRTSEPNNTQLNGQPMEVHFEIATPVPIGGASLSFQACDSLQQPVLHLWTFDSERPMCREPGTFQLVCRIPKARLYVGRYTLTVHFSERAGGRKFQTLEGICPFEVVLYGWHREFEWRPGTCAYLEDCDWRVEKLTPWS